MEENKFGILLTKDILLHRQYFKEMTKLHGINVLYRAPQENKAYYAYGELEPFYHPPELVGCINTIFVYTADLGIG